jgi:hypothetical protein
MKNIAIAIGILALVVVLGYQQWQLISIDKKIETKLDKVIGVTIEGKENPLDLATFNVWILNKILEAQKPIN